MSKKKHIQFILIYKDESILVNTFTGEFCDLRELIMAKLNLANFGECGGVGRCVTCLVLLNSNKGSEEFACQVPVNQGLANCNIQVVGDRLEPL